LNIRYLLTSISKIFLLYIILVDFFINFLNINLLSFKKLKKTSSLVLYYFLVNSWLLESKDFSLKLSFYFSLILRKKIKIQVYKQIIITIIKEFILKKLDLNTLLLVKDKDKLKKLVTS
jgi:hypothetical protein